MLDDGSCNRQAIVGARASADFIQDDQAMSRCMMQDGGRFLHFYHEGTLPRRNIILSTDAGEDAIYQSYACTTRWHEAPYLRQQRNQCHLAQISGFSRHVWPGQ